MSEGESRLFAIVDCAADPRLHRWVTALPHDCLFAGRIEPELAAAAPYLVELDARSPLGLAWRDEGRGKGWGILCRSAQTREALRRHFRHFLRAKLPDGEIVHFRFYDPRVMATYWPTCTAEEKAEFMAGLEEVLVEEEAGEFRNIY